MYKLINVAVLIQMTSRVHSDQFEQMMSLAMDGCRQIHSIMDNAVRESMKSLSQSI
jgi:ribonuclease PH